MADLNQDGLIPGQPVDFETLQRVERSRAIAVKPDEIKEPARPRGRPRSPVVSPDSVEKA